MPKYIIWMAVIVLLLSGCAAAAEPEPTVPAQTTAAPLETILPPETVPMVSEEAAILENAPDPAAVIPETCACAAREARCDQAVIDYSHAEAGYVMVRWLAQTDRRLKALVKGPTATYSYNLTPENWVVLPLSDGSGDYQIGVYENVEGSKYATVLTEEFAVELQDEFAPFLRPNQYVDYSAATKAVEKGLELTRGLSDPLEKVEAVYDFVVGTLTYDHEKASAVKSGYIPVLDQVLEEEKGICFDYAALMAAMLRSQQIPCKLVVGYAGETYHAWISVWTEENGWVDGIIFFDGQTWKRMDPTFASSGGGDPEIMDFIENGSYTAKYLY